MNKKDDKVSFRAIIDEFLSAFNLDRGMIPTVRDLLIRPNVIINHYIEGKELLKIYKEKYFLPGRFFVSVFFIVGICSFFFGDNILNPESLRSSSGVFNYNPNATIGSLEEADTFHQNLRDVINKYMMLVVVLSGIIPYTISTKLVFIKKKEYTLSMHFVTNIYFQCVIMLFCPIVLFFSPTYEFYIFILMTSYFLYYTYAFKSIFQLSFFRAIWNGILIQIISGILAIILGVSFTILALLLFGKEILGL